MQLVLDLPHASPVRLTGFHVVSLVDALWDSERSQYRTPAAASAAEQLTRALQRAATASTVVLDGAVGEAASDALAAVAVGARQAVRPLRCGPNRPAADDRHRNSEGG
jgi:pantothenate synthetase